MSIIKFHRTLLIATCGLMLAGAVVAEAKALNQPTPQAPKATTASPYDPVADQLVTSNPVEETTSETSVAEISDPTETPAKSLAWTALTDTDRYLLIMGTMDGLSAALAEKAPCFAGRSNADIDVRLKASGFNGENGVGLTEALIKISDECPGSANRGYTLEIVKDMPDVILSTYISGVVRSWSTIGLCKPETEAKTATITAAIIIAGEKSDSPVARLVEALYESCAKDSE